MARNKALLLQRLDGINAAAIGSALTWTRTPVWVPHRFAYLVWRATVAWYAFGTQYGYSRMASRIAAK